MSYSGIEQIYTGKNDENIFISFLNWWFYDLPRKLIFISVSFIKKLYRYFSLNLLFRTLFAPWKRDLLDTRGLPLEGKIEVWLMNLVSRAIGFVIRAFTIVFALFFIAVASVISLAIILILITMPLLIIFIISLSLV